MSNHWRKLLGGLFVLSLVAGVSPAAVAAHAPTTSGPDRTAPWIAPGAAAPVDTSHSATSPWLLDHEDDATDPGRNVALPCEGASLPSLAPNGRSNRNMVHIANRCGFVGTDVEFQSRVHRHSATINHVHDYAFVGTMGDGLRIFDVTNPLNPRPAGSYFVNGWQNDVQVRGNVAILTFDGLSNEPSETSTCMDTHHPTALGQGIEVIELSYNQTTANFLTGNLTCVPNAPGGTHTATIHPSGRYIALSNSSSDWAVDIVDLRGAAAIDDEDSGNLHKYRLIDESRATTASNIGQQRCPTGAPFRCIVMTRSWGVAKGTTVATANSAKDLFRPHDLHFSRDGNTMYVAAIQSTFIVDVRNLFASLPLTQKVRTLSIIPNNLVPKPPCSPTGSNPACDPRNLTISHQADVTSDGKILVVSDERGGGLQETGCNTDQYGILGGLHFFALAPITGVPASANASPTNPKTLGHYFHPNPGFGPDPLEPIVLPVLGRLERGCTAHVFRLGGNGTASPGSGTSGFDGVSRLPKYRLTEGWYGAGTWQMDFSRRSSNTDGVTEDPRSSWGNTLAWNVQPGADTWSAKEYKGFVYTGDMLRGFDVFTNGAGQDPVVLMTKTGPSTATRGSTFSYQLSYRNVGPAASQDARITDCLPRGLSFVSASGGATYDTTTRCVRWRLGSVAAGATGTRSLKVRVWPSVADGTVITNRAYFWGVATISPPSAVAHTRISGS